MAATMLLRVFSGYSRVVLGTNMYYQRFWEWWDHESFAKVISDHTFVHAMREAFTYAAGA
jgi:hypothetical protein